MTRFYRSLISLRRLFSENIYKILPFLFFSGILSLLISCEESPSKIGSELLPGSDFVTIKSTDTIKVKSYTMYADSVKSDNPATSYLGEKYDPYFGRTTAEFVSQLRLSAEMDTLKYLAIDSVKLNLKFLTVTGSVSEVHYLRLSEIANQIYDTLAYYSNQNVPLTGYTVPDILLPTLRADTINDIEVTVPNSFGVYLTRNISMLFMDNAKPDFRSYFKGLYFQLISPSDPVLVSLSIASPGTYNNYANYFTVYTHNTLNAVSASYDFLIDARITNASFNLFKHDYSAGEAGKKISHINDMYPDTLSYAQTMNGVFTRIKIPGLADLKKDPLLDKIAVNKARLIFPFVADGDFYKPSTIPSILYLRYLTTTGHKWLVSDYTTAGTAFYDGTPDTTTANAYNINIATYLQDYLEDTKDTIKPELELFLLPSSSYNVILKANKSYKPVKFEFTYTKF